MKWAESRQREIDDDQEVLPTSSTATESTENSTPLMISP